MRRNFPPYWATPRTGSWVPPPEVRRPPWSYEALAGADGLAVVTEWNEFREPDYPKMRQLLKQPVVFDGRNIYSPAHMRALGFTYFSIGR